jgi:hypothetical protein
MSDMAPGSETELERGEQAQMKALIYGNQEMPLIETVNRCATYMKRTAHCELSKYLCLFGFKHGYGIYKYRECALIVSFRVIEVG